MIIEAIGDNKIEDPIVLAKKQFAEQMATASKMTYKTIKGSDADKGNYHHLMTDDPQPSQPQILQ